MLSAVLRVQGDDGQFSLALSRQELGDYEVEYEAVDDAGNDSDGQAHLQRGAEGAVRGGRCCRVGTWYRCLGRRWIRALIP